ERLHPTFQAGESRREQKAAAAAKRKKPCFERRTGRSSAFDEANDHVRIGVDHGSPQLSRSCWSCCAMSSPLRRVGALPNRSNTDAGGEGSWAAFSRRSTTRDSRARTASGGSPVTSMECDMIRFLASFRQHNAFTQRRYRGFDKLKSAFREE